MQTLVGFTQAERGPTIIGFISLAMVGRGRTAIPFHFFIHRSIQIGISTICRVLNLGGSKDFRTKRGFGGGGISALICKSLVISDRSSYGELRRLKKKKEFHLTKAPFSGFFEIFLSFLRLFFESYFV